MIKHKQNEPNTLEQGTYQEALAPLVQDIRESAAGSYDSLDGDEYLDAVFSEMKAMFNRCDFESRKNPMTKMRGGSIGTPINTIYWPVIPSEKFYHHSMLCRHRNRVPHVPS
jgi:hypothetical protein